MKRNFIISITLATAIGAIALINGCKTPEYVSSKSGAQLWGENCNRCHNAPDPLYYSDSQWDVALEHMRVKALLTDVEVKKIAEFLKASN